MKTLLPILILLFSACNNENNIIEYLTNDTWIIAPTKRVSSLNETYGQVSNIIPYEITISSDEPPENYYGDIWWFTHVPNNNLCNLTNDKKVLARTNHNKKLVYIGPCVYINPENVDLIFSHEMFHIFGVKHLDSGMMSKGIETAIQTTTILNKSIVVDNEIIFTLKTIYGE